MNATAVTEGVRALFRGGQRLFNVVLIETHSACNRSCWFCKFGQARDHDPELFLDMGTIERIVLNLARLKYRGRISWYFINEPLMDDRMAAILEFTRTHCPDAFLSLVTNGDLLEAETFRRLRGAGLDALGVSVYDEKTFLKMRQMPRDARLSIMDMRHPRVDNRGGNIKTKPAQFRDAAGLMLGHSCNRPFDMLVINSKGEVVLCCSDLYGDVVMGSVKEEAIEEIWNNDRFRHYRSTLEKQGRKGLPLCDGCSQDGRSSYVYFPLPPAGRIQMQASRWLRRRTRKGVGT